VIDGRYGVNIVDHEASVGSFVQDCRDA